MIQELRRHLFTLALACVLLVGSMLPLGGEGARGATTCVFSPNGKDRLIHKALFKEIDSARKDLRLMLYQFTSRDLVSHIRNARSKARVRVILDAEQARRIPVSAHAELEKAGVDVRFVELPGTGAEAAKFHHKVLIVDDRTVVTGSYNWSVLADEENYENIVIIDDPALARTYAAEFDRIWERANEEVK